MRKYQAYLTGAVVGLIIRGPLGAVGGVATVYLVKRLDEKVKTVS